MHREYGDPATGLDAGIREEAVEVLMDLRDWRLDSWDRVAQVLERLGSAVAAGDEATVRAATIELELLSPYRTHAMGDMDKPPSKAMLDDVAKLVYVLGDQQGDHDRMRGPAASDDKKSPKKK